MQGRKVVGRVDVEMLDGDAALGTVGSEVTCATQSRDQAQREELLGQRLPRTAAVLDINAFAMLRQFMGGRGHYWAALHGALSPEQEAMLGSDGPPFAESPVVADDPVHLSAEDEKILGALAADGRASLVDLARAADSTPGRVSRRLGVLLQQRVVHIDVEIAPAALGYHARANLWLRVHPSEVKNVGRSLAREPEIAFAAAISGPCNITRRVPARLRTAVPVTSFQTRASRTAAPPACRPVS
ncbi:Lrp/AsnC family transcriptional regulator [Streptomyces noursei]|uniref:Lrp/AsnC family transcriptional regulator n=1 Tax=Streptomyces noursei TaxID=1971 RepID=UPI0038036D05